MVNLDSDLKGYSKYAKRRRDRLSVHEYAEVSALAYEILDRTLYRLSYIKTNPKRVLVLSPIPAYAAQSVRSMYPEAELLIVSDSAVLLDHAAGLGMAQVDFCANLASLSPSGFDVVISHLHLAQAPLQPELIEDFRRWLLPDGVVMAATFGLDTLKELAGAFAAVDGADHVNPYPDMHDIGDMMMASGLVHPVVDMAQYVVEYEMVDQLLYDVRHAGIGCFASNPVKNVYTRSMLESMYDAYPKSDGVCPATFEVIYAHAFAAAVVNKQLSATETAIPLASISLRR